MRVPLVVRAPGDAAAVDVRAAHLVDIAPSVLDVLHAPAHPAFQGESLVRTDANPARSVYMVVQSPLADQVAIVRGQYKLIVDETTGRHSLYTVVKDPGERADLAESRPELVRELAECLYAWRAAQIVPRSIRSRIRRWWTTKSLRG